MLRLVLTVLSLLLVSPAAADATASPVATASTGRDCGKLNVSTALFERNVGCRLAYRVAHYYMRTQEPPAGWFARTRYHNIVYLRPNGSTHRYVEIAFTEAQ